MPVVSNITNAQLAQKISDLVNSWRTFMVQLQTWLAGTVGGGPNGDGKYPLTDSLGNTYDIEAPAQLAADVTTIVGNATAQATSATGSATSAASSADMATTQATNAAASAAAATTKATAADTAANLAQSYSAAAGTFSANAAASETAAAADAAASHADRLLADADVTASAASASAAAASAALAVTGAIPGDTGPVGPPGATGAQGSAGTPGAPGAAGVNASALIQQRGVTWSNGFNAVIAPAPDVPIIIAEDCTIQDLTILTEGGVGSCALDIWRVGFASFPPSSANSIISSTSYPAITAGVTLRDTTLSGFSNTSLSKGDVVVFHLRSSTIFTEVVVLLSLKRVGDTVATGYTDARAQNAVTGMLSNSGNVKFTVTPNASVSANVSIGGGASNLSPTGFSTGIDGLIHQWGVVNIPAAGGATVVFPLAFPSACFVVNLTPASATNGTPYVTSSAPTGFTCDNSAGATSINHYWHAIGK